MSSLTVCNRIFTPTWWGCMIAGLGIALFSTLGVWQLHRAQEKQDMLHHMSVWAKHPPQSFDADQPLPAQYQRLLVTGKWLPDILLLDNQHHQHQFGYHVLSPLQIRQGKVLLVDKGFVLGDITRQTLPDLEHERQSTQVKNRQWLGQAYYPSKNKWLLGPVLEKKTAHVAVIEWIDIAEISQFLHKSLYPFIIRLQSDEQSSFAREWPVVAISPERHIAYAVQWFAMACTVFILWVLLSLKKYES